jgi:hypothetical protein
MTLCNGEEPVWFPFVVAQCINNRSVCDLGYFGYNQMCDETLQDISVSRFLFLVLYIVLLVGSILVLILHIIRRKHVLDVKMLGLILVFVSSILLLVVLSVDPLGYEGSLSYYRWYFYLFGQCLLTTANGLSAIFFLLLKRTQKNIFFSTQCGFLIWCDLKLMVIWLIVSVVHILVVLISVPFLKQSMVVVTGVMVFFSGGIMLVTMVLLLNGSIAVLRKMRKFPQSKQQFLKQVSIIALLGSILWIMAAVLALLLLIRCFVPVIDIASIHYMLFCLLNISCLISGCSILFVFRPAPPATTKVDIVEQGEDNDHY